MLVFLLRLNCHHYTYWEIWFIILPLSYGKNVMKPDNEIKIGNE
jgi:hypothetical protein